MKYIVLDEKQQVIDSCQSEHMALYSANSYRDRTGRRADIYTQSTTFLDDDGELRGGFNSGASANSLGNGFVL